MRAASAYDGRRRKRARDGERGSERKGGRKKERGKIRQKRTQMAHKKHTYLWLGYQHFSKMWHTQILSKVTRKTPLEDYVLWLALRLFFREGREEEKIEGKRGQ